MNREDQLNIFRAQTENVQDINKTWKHVQKTINHEIVCDNFTSASVQANMNGLNLARIRVQATINESLRPGRTGESEGAEIANIAL